MTKNEFEQTARATVSDEAYADIEYVYTWHPAIKAVGGKEQIAAIFNAGGMMLIQSMKEAASLAEVVEGELKETLRKVDRLNVRIRYLEKGEVSLERCIRDLKGLCDVTVTQEAFETMADNLKMDYGCEMVEEARDHLGAGRR